MGRPIKSKPAPASGGVFRSLLVLMQGLEEGELWRSPEPDHAVGPPSLDADREPLAVARSFAFLDISGFTAYCDRFGELEAFALLATFRDTTRAVAARRGVRVAKWLGDGVMLVGIEPAPLVATVAEIALRCAIEGIDTHAGMASGDVLLFEGDDYIGRPVNLSARLCDQAALGEVLVADQGVRLPGWLTVVEVRNVAVAGVDEPVDVLVVEPNAELVDDFSAA